MHDYSLELFNTDLRWMCLVWSGSRLSRLSFYHDSATTARTLVETEIGRPLCLRADASKLARCLTRYAAGQNISFKKIKVKMSGTIFQKKVLSCCQKIPYGNTMSYGEVAKQVGHPGAARAVGGVMRGNNCPLVVPCHRVLGSNNKLTGFSAGTGIKLKHRLLQMEGINRDFVF
jgi:methylated-DNA-[protein]-cysteine S-methyltransferase